MITTRYVPDLPISVRGFVVKDAEDNYTVVLNPAYCYEAQRETAMHEREHIVNDYREEVDVNAVEALRHK